MTVSEIAMTVSELLEGIRQTLDENFRRVTVTGEISGFRQPGSGHGYFVLKDDESQLRAVIWRSTARRLAIAPKDGMQIEVRGRIDLYPARGEMQLIVDGMRLAGDGAAHAALEALKVKLRKEGLFSESAKKRLPARPRCIGVVTSGSGAALQDITSIVARRYPIAVVLVRPVRVQGMESPQEIVRAIEAFNRVALTQSRDIDVLIVGRGGGTAEDLWAFNDEAVARAIFASRIPIVSAVGHETDFTIADLVADVRAATPSMAAELVVPDRIELQAELGDIANHLTHMMARKLNLLRQRVDYMTGSYHFRRTIDRLKRLSADLALLQRRARLAVGRTVGGRQLFATSLLRRLNSSEPLRPLRNGYALIRRGSAVVTSAAALERGDPISLTFHDGKRTAEVTGTAFDAPVDTAGGTPAAHPAALPER